MTTYIAAISQLKNRNISTKIEWWVQIQRDDTIKLGWVQIQSDNYKYKHTYKYRGMSTNTDIWVQQYIYEFKYRDLSTNTEGWVQIPSDKYKYKHIYKYRGMNTNT